MDHLLSTCKEAHILWGLGHKAIDEDAIQNGAENAALPQPFRKGNAGPMDVVVVV